MTAQMAVNGADKFIGASEAYKDGPLGLQARWAARGGIHKH